MNSNGEYYIKSYMNLEYDSNEQTSDSEREVEIYLPIRKDHFSILSKNDLSLLFVRIEGCERCSFYKGGRLTMFLVLTANHAVSGWCRVIYSGACEVDIVHHKREGNYYQH